ncbi:MAG: CinA family protein, partial [Candidatus Omnitrophota bacterium]|nr:CinA family protein [Candidatus Omnitrophota bacterium]
GLASDRVTDVPGSSGYFHGGITAYSNDVKVSVLGVSPRTVREYGAVSRQVALEMAKGALTALGADIAASVTGIAGPSGGSGRKPVGLAYMAFATKRKRRTRKVLFKGGRRALKEKFAQALLEFVLENIL